MSKMSHSTADSECKKKRIREIFETMSYGEVTENDTIAKVWLDKNGQNLGSFINGSFVNSDNSFHEYEVIKNPCNGKTLATVPIGSDYTLEAAIKSSSAAFCEWKTVSGHQRAQYLYNIARNIQKHLQLTAILESIDSGKLVNKTKTQDVTTLIRSFYHNAGWAELWDSEMRDWKPIGVICVQTEEYNNPLMCISWRISSALASGNTVVLVPDISCCLSSLLFAQICSASGLPPGVLNVVPIKSLKTFPTISKLIFSGRFEQSQNLRKIAGENHTDIDVHCFGRPTVLVFEGADLHSAAEGALENLYFNDARCQSGGCLLLVQDSIKDDFISKLKARFQKLTLGTNLSKTDITDFSSDIQFMKLHTSIIEAKEQGAEVLSLPTDGGFISPRPPTLVINVQTSSTIVTEMVGGPIISVIPFRTAKEAIMMVNHNKVGSDVSVWSEKLTAALQIAHMIKAGTVWVNCQNQVDAAAGYGGVYRSGNTREGGKSGLYHFVTPNWMNVEKKSHTVEYSHFGESSSCNTEVNPVKVDDGNKLMDYTFKLYYGGAQKRPDSNTPRAIYNDKKQMICHVPDGSRKDIRNAVECALSVQEKWQHRTGHNRAQILYYVAENLDLRKEEFAHDLHLTTGKPKETCIDEVTLSVERLFFWAAYSDKYGGTIQETEMYGKVLESNEPLGVIGITCPDECPLLSFISLLAPAVSRGNTVVIVPSEKFPISALKMCQVFDTSDVPGGVINVITGCANHLTRILALHMEVDAIWLHRNTEIGQAFVRTASTTNQKRVWVDDGRDWLNKAQGQGMEFLLHATYSKTIWLPMGDIFAN